MSEVDQNTTLRRFVLSNERNIIDVCHPETMVPSYMNYNRRATSVEELEIKYDDDLHLREVVLKARLQELAGKLLKRPDEAGWLESLLWEIIVASSSWHPSLIVVLCRFRQDAMPSERSSAKIT
jgi:hypothetical protein